MTNKKLFEQAVADAKTVKEAAMKNAKLQLEEELAPRLEQVWASKLQEVEEELDENFIPEEGDDFNLDEMLAELELEETAGLDPLAESEDLDEAKKDDDKKEDKKDDDKKDDKPKSDSKPKEPKEPKEEKVSDLTVDDLKAIIADVVSSEMGSIESEEHGDEFGGMDDVNDDFNAPDMGGEEIPGAEDMTPDMGGEDDEDINLDELLAELDNLDEVDEKDEMNEVDDLKAELNEAIKTIKFLQKELADVNLLNAKMTYVNKLSEGRNLSNTQKVKIIAALDKVNNVKEAKLVYEALNSSLTVIGNKQQPKRLVKENLGFASKPAGVAPRKQIVEVNENVNRWQFLAGIKTK